MGLITSGCVPLSGHGGHGGEPWPTSALPMENPCCSCKLTRVRQGVEDCADGVSSEDFPTITSCGECASQQEAHMDCRPTRRP